MTEEKILARVRKLLNLANDAAATEGERENALRMAHATLTKHALDMEDVSEFDRNKIDPRGEYNTEGWNLPWCRQIRAAVAKLFNCSYFYQKINATRGKHSFVGRESNSTTAMYMSEFIITGMLKECDKRYGHRLTPGGRSFGEGAAARLWSRVYDMQKTQQREFTAAGSALVVQDIATSEKAENEAWLKANVGDLVKAKARNSKVDINAYRAGADHANSISLNTQVTNKKGTKQLT